MIEFKDLAPAINQFFQTHTYYGLLEGTPNSRINKGIVKSSIDKGKRLFGIDTIHLIQPVEKKKLLQSGKEMASLPRITCFAELSHYKPMQDLSQEQSVLCLIWYQDRFAFPIDEAIVAQIKQLSWTELSEDTYL
jgi:hypothetical protein